MSAIPDKGGEKGQGKMGGCQLGSDFNTTLTIGVSFVKKK